MTDKALTDISISISELQDDPMKAIASANGMPIAVLEGNEPVFYCVPVAAYESLMERIEDAELLNIINKRMNGETIKLTLDDL